jgi:hypothetical protein
MPALLLIPLLTAAVLACNDDDDEGEPTPGVTQTAAATPTGQPSDTTTATRTADVGSPTEGDGTGNDDLDEVIASVLEGDMGALVERAQPVTLACTTAPGAGGPPQCETGEMQGTMVEVFPFGSCQGEYVRQEDLQGLFDRELGATSPLLYAVFELEDEGTADFPRGDYGLLFETDATGGPAGMRHGIIVGASEDGDIISLWRGCQATPEALFDSQRDPDGEVLVSPGS